MRARPGCSGLSSCFCSTLWLGSLFLHRSHLRFVRSQASSFAGLQRRFSCLTCSAGFGVCLESHTEADGINRRLLSLALVEIDRRLLLGSIVGSCWDRPSAFVGIDRRLLLGSTVGFCWDRPSALSPVTESTIKRTNTRDVGVRRSSAGDVLKIDRKLQGELC
jgi:hypothetical protein